MMATQEITYLGRTLELSFDWHTQGTKVNVWEYTGKEWEPLISNTLYILQTDFEILCEVAAEVFGESIHAETLAPMLGIPIRSSEEAECIYCGKWEHYSEGKYDEKSFTYACNDCAYTQEILNTPLRDYLDRLTDENWHTLRFLIEHQLGIIDPAKENMAYRAYLSAKSFLRN